MQNSKPESIEAHQAALIAVAAALDLDWDGDRPIIKSESSWPRFSLNLQTEDASQENVKRLDYEQIYFQTFVLETCLRSLHTAEAGLAFILFEAWNYYLKTLPKSHGVDFDYNIWLNRRERYIQAWNEAIDRREKNPEMTKNPYFPLSMCLIEDICCIGPDIMVVSPITIITTEKAGSFIKMSNKFIIDRE
jgi:hypothetical protein